MAYKYYDDWEFKKIMATSGNNPYRAAIELKEYLEKYPLDYTTYPYYISILIIIGQFNAARENLDYIETILESGVYKNDAKRNDILKYSILYSKFKLLCCEEKYKEAYDLYVANAEIIDSFDVNKIVYFLKIKLGLLEENIEERAYLPYFYRQAIDYQESDFLHHAKKHCKDTLYGDEEAESEFVSGFPIEDVVTEIKKYIPSNRKLYHGFVDNTYFFKYDNCGSCDKKMINYIKVITFNESNKIITMYPYLNGERFSYVDLNYMKVEDSPKVRRRSQIDKFNDRLMKSKKY